MFDSMKEVGKLMDGVKQAKALLAAAKDLDADHDGVNDLKEIVALGTTLQAQSGDLLHEFVVLAEKAETDAINDFASLKAELITLKPKIQAVKDTGNKVKALLQADFSALGAKVNLPELAKLI